MAVMPIQDPASAHPEGAPAEVTTVTGVQYLALGPVEAEEAVIRRAVPNPVAGIDDIVLDFDADGRLLGIEFRDDRALPPGLMPGA